MDLSTFKVSDWLKVGGGLLFFVAGFLSWWKLELGYGLGADGLSGVGDYFGTVGIAWLLFVAIAVVTALTALGKLSLPATLPVPLIMLGAAVLGALLVLLRFLSDGIGFGVDLERGIGAWLGVLATVAVVAGCVLAFTESGGSFADITNQVSDAAKKINSGDSAPGATPPAPPSVGETPPPPPPPPAP